MYFTLSYRTRNGDLGKIMCPHLHRSEVISPDFKPTLVSKVHTLTTELYGLPEILVNPMVNLGSTWKDLEVNIAYGIPSKEVKILFVIL